MRAFTPTRAPASIPNPASRLQRPTGPTQVPPAAASVALRSLHNTRHRVQGPVTGRFYEFSGAQSVQPVDSQDAAALLSTRLFQRA
jgi:hypothetical protein